jgi:hypothetical protein
VPFEEFGFNFLHIPYSSLDSHFFHFFFSKEEGKEKENIMPRDLRAKHTMKREKLKGKYLEKRRQRKKRRRRLEIGCKVKKELQGNVCYICCTIVLMVLLVQYENEA